MSDNLNEILTHLVARAEARGASGADALAVDVTEGTVRVRLGEVEQIQQSHERRVGLRVFVGQRQAMTSASDLRLETLDRLVDDTIAMAQVTAEDPSSGLPAAGACAAAHVERADLYDPEARGFDLQRGVAWAKAAEAAATVDARIQNSEGAEFGFSEVLRCFAASGGVGGSYRTSGFSGYVVPVATDGKVMERDYHWTQRRHVADLVDAAEVGQIAAARTLRRLGAVQAKTAKVPVIFDDRMASRLVGFLGSSASGYGIYRGASYLRERLGAQVAAPHITIVDDATLSGGLGTKPYDGEGVGTSKKAIVEEGKLVSYLLDTYSGRKLDLASTGNAARSVGDAPTVAATNLHLLPGTVPEAALFEGVKSGLYVTELIGFGFDATTGDYSQGASGMWIEDGKLSHAVNEITIAGNLLQMFKDIDLVADNLNRYKSVSAPSLRIRELTVAGA